MISEEKSNALKTELCTILKNSEKARKYMDDHWYSLFYDYRNALRDEVDVLLDSDDLFSKKEKWRDLNNKVLKDVNDLNKLLRKLFDMQFYNYVVLKIDQNSDDFTPLSESETRKLIDDLKELYGSELK